jgi:glycosyltransferase involved in cell wall biosynthesis
VDAARLLVEGVLPLVQQEHPDASLLLIGRSPTAAVLGMRGPAVEVTGAVADVRPWLERAAVYAAPLTRGTGLKNKVLEAMAAGLPVVATPLATAGIGAGDGLIEADDVAAFAAALCRLLSDPAARRSMGHAARHRIERDHTWAANAQRMAGLWEELAVGRPR